MTETSETQGSAVAIKLDDIKFNEATKSMAAIAWIPIVGFILMFVEKKDTLVRYNGAQSTIIGLLHFLFSIVWGAVTGALWYFTALWGIFDLVSTVVSLITLVLIVFGILQTIGGKRFDVPVVSEWALKLVNMIK